MKINRLIPKNIFKIFVLFQLFLILNGCDEGLQPQPDKTSYLTGTIHYIDSTSNWPSSDSLFDLRVVAFKDYPPTNIIQEVLANQAYFTTNALPFYVHSENFSIEIKDAPVDLKYIAVAQQYGPTIFTDWQVVGVYSVIPDSAATIHIEQGKIYNIDINVDFKHLPVQPFPKGG